VIALVVVEVPEEHSLSEGALLARGGRRLLREVAQASLIEGLEVNTVLRVAHQAWQGIYDTVAEESVDLILFGWKGRSRKASRILDETVNRIVEEPPCDVAVVKQGSSDTCDSVLVPVRGGPQAEMALNLVSGIAEKNDANVTLMRVEREKSPRGERLTETRAFSALAAGLARTGRVRPLTVAADSVEEAILTEAPRHQLVVIGAAVRHDGNGTLVGDIPEAVASGTNSSVMVVKTRQAINPAQFQQEEEPVDVLVDRWFAENTFHSREFDNIDELVELKRQQGLTISLGIPARDQNDTVENVLQVIRGELVERKQLLDEVVLLDYGSSDGTPEIARHLGVEVCSHEDVLPEYGSYLSKGDALWKSLFQLKGDIIVWMNADIKNIHPKFVYGVVGPLLRDEHIKYVKGFYRRPLVRGGSGYETGYELGMGRVAELTARPFLNLFFPELSGLIQPLSREHAGRREILEQLPFFTGYGVEMGLLIDVLTRFGLSAIGQSDLEERVHRKEPLDALSQRSFSVIRVVMRRLEEREKVRLLEDFNTSMKLIHSQGERFFLELQQLEEAERPPMITVEEYAKKKLKAAMKVSR
jgi:glucosyl-3-phosphoglycerate synthase